MSISDEDLDPEVIAISVVFNALKSLTPDAQSRVLDYVQRKLRRDSPDDRAGSEAALEPEDTASGERPPSGAVQETDTDEGINAVARKWMRRNGLTSEALGSLFSLGVDDIELVAKKVPGDTKKERMHSVLLLRGVASYLGTGAARFTHADLKETCLHYDAYDVANSTAYLKSFASEVSGTAKSGYALSARGLAAATELVKSLVTKK
jgi:hypothetical protein